MWYELWDSETGNRVGVYSTEDAALRSVLDDITTYGSGAKEIISLSLLQRDPEHLKDRVLVEGAALADRALALNESPTSSRR